MTGNKMGNKGGMHFASMLQMNNTLEELDVSDCHLVMWRNKTLSCLKSNIYLVLNLRGPRYNM